MAVKWRGERAAGALSLSWHWWDGAQLAQHPRQLAQVMAGRWMQVGQPSRQRDSGLV